MISAAGPSVPSRVTAATTLTTTAMVNTRPAPEHLRDRLGGMPPHVRTNPTSVIPSPARVVAAYPDFVVPISIRPELDSRVMALLAQVKSRITDADAASRALLDATATRDAANARATEAVKARDLAKSKLGCCNFWYSLAISIAFILFSL